ncbi:hypothetical protein BS17DRAFT_790259 [Gyrodon lividus]|nr:hypothetical protein BS17DRAFT_790259 [Gyrodon lividus]
MLVWTSRATCPSPLQPPHSTPASVTSTLLNSIAGLSAPASNATIPSLVNIPALHVPSRIAVDETISVLPMATTAPAAIVPSAPKKAPKMRPGPARNGRNLAVHQWLKHFKSTTNGTTTKYFLSLNNTQWEAYDREAEQIVAHNAWNKDAYAGKMY